LATTNALITRPMITPTAVMSQKFVGVSATSARTYMLNSHHIQAVRGVRHDLRALRLRLGLFRHREVQAKLRVLQQQFGRAFHTRGLISQIDQIAVQFYKFTRLLQCAMQATRAAQHGSDGFERPVVLGCGLCGVLFLVEIIQPRHIGRQVVLQRKTSSIVRAGFPSTVWLPPKQRRPPGDIIGPGQLMKNDEQVLLLKDRTLRTCFPAHPVANGLRNGGPKFRNDLNVWFHDWDCISIPPP
jgi:hypothetical protein